MSIDEIYEDLIENIKDLDYSRVKAEELKKDTTFLSLVGKYKEIFNPGSRRTEAEKDNLKKEIIKATKNLIRTKFLVAKDKTVNITLSLCKNKNKLTPLQDIEESLGLDLENHSDIHVMDTFRYSCTGPKDNDYMDNINITTFANSHILMIAGQATKMSGSDVAYIMNHLKGKIVFLSDVDKESPFNRYDIPYSQYQNLPYKKIKNPGTNHDMFLHEKAKTILFNDDGTPKISYLYYNEGYVFQWYGTPHFSDEEEKDKIDETLYSILTMLVIRMNYANNEGGEVDEEGNLLISGSPADSKTVVVKKTGASKIFPPNIPYSEDGYTGVLDKKGAPVVISGSYQTSDTITITTKITLDEVVSNDANAFEDTIVYEKDGYKGILKRSGIKWDEDVQKRKAQKKNKTDTSKIKAADYTEASTNMLEQTPKYVDYSFKDPDTNKTITTKLKLKYIDCIKKEPLYDQCNGFFYWMDNNKHSEKMVRKRPYYPVSYYGERPGFNQKHAISAVWLGKTEGPGLYISDKNIKNRYRRPVGLVYRKQAGYEFTFKRVWEGTVDLPDYHTNVYSGEAEYTGEVVKDEVDDRVWEQTYEGTVNKPDDRVYGSSIDQQIKEIEDDPFTSYNVKKQLIKMDSAKRHVVKINEIESSKNKYKKNSYMESIDLIKHINSNLKSGTSRTINNVSAIGFFCNEYIPDHFTDKENCIKYFMTINGRQYEVLPVNSTRNGKKIIRTTEVESDSEYVIYLNEPIKSAYLTVVFNLPNNEETPFISNFKVLIG